MCDRYDEDYYVRMRNDTLRTSAYREAIQAIAPGRVCLDLGTGGLALLAVFAARAGAKHVYALEANADAAEAAEQVVLEEGLGSTITVLRGYSRDVQLSLSPPPDLLIHEILGEFAGGEGVAAAVRDAADRLLAPPADPSLPRSIPARARTLLAPVAALPDGAKANNPPWTTQFPPPFLPTRKGLTAPQEYGSFGAGVDRARDLAAPQVFEELLFDELSPQTEQQRTLVFRMRRPGSLLGLVLTMEASVRADAPTPPVSSAAAGSSWRAPFLRLPSGPAPVVAGQTLAVRCNVSLGAQPWYEFEVWLGLPPGALARGRMLDAGAGGDWSDPSLRGLQRLARMATDGTTVHVETFPVQGWILGPPGHTPR